MDEDLELDLSQDEAESRAQKRIRNLSSKAEDALKERDEATAKAQESESARLAAEKRAEFLESFSGQSTKYPAASEFRDAIQEKVLTSGYSVEDATVAVLVSEGRFTAPATQDVQSMAAGGSAATAISANGRPIGEMSQAERRAALMEAENSGELRQILERRN